MNRCKKQIPPMRSKFIIGSFPNTEGGLFIFYDRDLPNNRYFKARFAPPALRPLVLQLLDVARIKIVNEETRFWHTPGRNLTCFGSFNRLLQTARDSGLVVQKTRTCPPALLGANTVERWKRNDPGFWEEGRQHEDTNDQTQAVDPARPMDLG